MKEVFFFQYKNFSQLISLQYIQFFFRNQSVGFFFLKSPIPPPKIQMVGLLLQAITAKIYWHANRYIEQYEKQCVKRIEPAAS